MHSFHKKQGRSGYVAIKLDMANAYDRVEWGILEGILTQLGFSPKFSALIMACVCSPMFSILLNGSPFGYFKSGRGLRQGDPLSPALFVIFSNILSRMIDVAVIQKELNGIKVSQSSPTISHLMYADDVVIYCKATKGEVNSVCRLLRQYCRATGQEINWGKSAVHFSNNTPRSTSSPSVQHHGHD